MLSKTTMLMEKATQNDRELRFREPKEVNPRPESWVQRAEGREPAPGEPRTRFLKEGNPRLSFLREGNPRLIELELGEPWEGKLASQSWTSESQGKGTRATESQATATRRKGTRASESWNSESRGKGNSRPQRAGHQRAKARETRATES